MKALKFKRKRLIGQPEKGNYWEVLPVERTDPCVPGVSLQVVLYQSGGFI